MALRGTEAAVVKRRERRLPSRSPCHTDHASERSAVSCYSRPSGRPISFALRSHAHAPICCCTCLRALFLPCLPFPSSLWRRARTSQAVPLYLLCRAKPPKGQLHGEFCGRGCGGMVTVTPSSSPGLGNNRRFKTAATCCPQAQHLAARLRRQFMPVRASSARVMQGISSKKTDCPTPRTSHRLRPMSSASRLQPSWQKTSLSSPESWRQSAPAPGSSSPLYSPKRVACLRLCLVD